MTQTGIDAPLNNSRGAVPHLPSRRTMIASAAWSIPVIVAVAAAPSVAASGARTLTVTTADMRVPASGPQEVKAQVKDGGLPALAGQVVSFTGPTGATFVPSAPTTDGSGTAKTTLTLGDPWAKPGSSVVITATSAGTTASQSLTLTGANLLAAGSGYTSSLAQESPVFPSPIVQVAGADFSATYALLADGTVWAKGRNMSGQLGDGSTTDRTTWAQIAGLTGVTQIAAGGQSGYALLSDGSVRSWGANAFGQLGDGTTTSQSTPTTVRISRSPLLNVTQIAAGYSSGHALTSTGEVYSWGANDNGQLGKGTPGNSLFAVAVVTAGTPSNPQGSALTGITQISSGRYTPYAVTSTGSVYSWGYNVNGQVGNGASGNGADQYRATLVLDTTPGSTATLSGVKAVSAGSFSGYALLTDNTVVAWGRNANGEVGTGTSVESVPRPAAVSGLSNVAQIAGGREFATAVLTDGSVWSWGGNFQGQLANGSTSGRSTPGAVSSLQGQSVARIGSQSLAFAMFLVTNV